MANGDNQVAVVCRIEDGVRMSPIRVQIRAAVDIQVIEFIPGPYRLVVLFQSIRMSPVTVTPETTCWVAAITIKVTIGQDGEVMMRSYDGNVALIARRSCKSLIELSRSHLPNHCPLKSIS